MLTRQQSACCEHVSDPGDEAGRFQVRRQVATAAGEEPLDGLRVCSSSTESGSVGHQLTEPPRIMSDPCDHCCRPALIAYITYGANLITHGAQLRQRGRKLRSHRRTLDGSDGSCREVRESDFLEKECDCASVK